MLPRSLLPLALVCSLLGCASPGSKPVSLSSAKSTPSDRVYFREDDNEGGGTIIAIRDSGAGRFCHMGFFVNGKLVARLAQEEFVKLVQTVLSSHDAISVVQSLIAQSNERVSPQGESD